jgi:hypothetical protein
MQSEMGVHEFIAESSSALGTRTIGCSLVVSIGSTEMGDTAPAVSWETQLPGAERGLPHLKSELWGTGHLGRVGIGRTCWFRNLGSHVSEARPFDCAQGRLWGTRSFWGRVKCEVPRQPEQMSINWFAFDFVITIPPKNACCASSSTRTARRSMQGKTCYRFTILARRGSCQRAEKSWSE